MVRSVVVMASLLLMVGGLLLQRSVTMPTPGSIPAMTAPVERAIPLTRIHLREPARRLDRAEVVAGADWWDHQDQARLDRLVELLRAESPVDGWTGLYACAGSQGTHMLLVVGRHGRLGTAAFAADGTLLACDDGPDETLPMIMPQVAGPPGRLAPAVARQLLLRLRYLRERSPVAWYDMDAPVPIRVTVSEADDIDHPGMVGLFPASSSGATGIFTRRAYGPCSARTKPSGTAPPVDPEPPLPVADN